MNSECKQCPHVVGDYTERDCGFPDCVGGWEKAYKDLQAKVKRLSEVVEVQRKLIVWEDINPNDNKLLDNLNEAQAALQEDK